MFTDQNRHDIAIIRDRFGPKLREPGVKVYLTRKDQPSKPANSLIVNFALNHKAQPPAILKLNSNPINKVNRIIPFFQVGPCVINIAQIPDCR